MDALRSGAVDNYHDPVTALGAEVSRKYGGTWAASAAPVAGSPFIVIVQQRESPGPISYRTLFILIVAALAAATVLAYVRLRSQKSR